MSVSQRPVIGSIAFEGKGFAFAEYILETVSECQVGSDTIIRTVRDTGIGSETVGARKTIAAEEFLAAPFFGGLNRKTGFVKFALKDVIIVALRVEPEL